MGLLRPEDDSFHTDFNDGSDPYWNESAWFGFNLPERKVTGWVYFYHRPNMKFSTGGVALWDDTGDLNQDCLFHDWGTPYATPGGADMFDFELPNGLTVGCEQPLQAYTLGYGAAADASRYLSQGCHVDLRFDGITPPHLSMMPKGQEEWGGDPDLAPVEGKLVNGHYRQPGRLRGTIRLHGETIDVDCYSLRDHSWGPRKLRTNPRGSLVYAIASDDSYFQVMGSAVCEADPGDGLADDVLNGSYLKDGLLGDITEGKLTISDRDRRGNPRSWLVECVDNHGRELYATGTSRNALQWTGYPFLLMWWHQLEVTFDGQTTCHAEGQDWWPIQQTRQYLRSIKS